MKSLSIILLTSFFVLPFRWPYNNAGSVISNPFPIKQVKGDSSLAIRIINGSTLKRLPAVVRDLSSALNESIFQEGLLLSKNGFDIYLYDVTCNSFENSAAIRYESHDTVFHLKLNRFNQKAADNALAATLIHEIMHCVLLDIYTRAKQYDEQAMNSIMSFGLNNNDPSNFFSNDFFVLINSDEGQHELIHRLFYPQMVNLLEHFAEIHKQPFSDPRDAEYIMWSGLQKTSAYKKLSSEEKREIELKILEAKGITSEGD